MQSENEEKPLEPTGETFRLMSFDEMQMWLEVRSKAWEEFQMTRTGTQGQNTSPESSPQNALPELLPAILQLVEQMAQTNEYLAQIISQDYADGSSSETGSDETLTGKPGRIIRRGEQ